MGRPNADPHDLFVKAMDQARFANSRLTGDQCHLAFTVENAFPTIQQQAQFILAPDEWGESARSRDRFESSANSAWLDYAIKLQRLLDALERMRAVVFDDEQPRDKTMGRIGNHHGVRIRRVLHARSDIRHVAKDVRLLAGTRAHHDRA